MTSDQLQRLLDYWEELRGEHPAPLRSDIRPELLGGLNRIIFLCEVLGEREGMDFRFLVFGSEIAERFQHYLKPGDCLSEKSAPLPVEEMRARYRAVVESIAPAQGHGQRDIDNVPYSYEAVTLPLLGQDGQTVSHILGAVIYHTAQEYRSRFPDSIQQKSA